MENESTLQAANNEIMRKIGRCVLLFQQLEGLLKTLLIHGRFSGNAQTLKSNYDDRATKFNKSTMGGVIGEFVGSMCGDSEDESIPPESGDQCHVSFHFKIGCTAEGYEFQKERLDEIREERNNLIHHLLPKYNNESLESCLAIDRELEQQMEKLLSEISNLKALVRSLNEGRKKVADFIGSEDGYRLVVEGLFPGEDSLDGLLRMIASKTARIDGWAPLVEAGKLITNPPVGMIADLANKVCKERGVERLTSLKKLINASPAFELLEEPTKRGTQWLFRLKESAPERPTLAKL